MKYNLQVLGIISLVVAAVSFSIWLEAGVWNECRRDHSWFYCYRVLSR